MLKWFKSLFTEKKLVYSTLDLDDYMRIVGRLEGAHVPYTLQSERSNRYFGTKWDSSSIPVEYNFYVNVEDEGRAHAAIHQE